MTDPIPEPEIRITVTHIATKDRPSGTECWVVESHRDPEAVKYWGGYFFVDDLEEAVQMVREQDAQKVRINFTPFKSYFCVRHKWL